jgi:predicted transcriptional regulator YdeE
VEPTIVKTDERILVGVSFYGDPFEFKSGWSEENEIGRTWKRFMALLEEHRPQLRHVVTDTVAFEVHIYSAETMQTGEFEVFVGLEVAELEDVPLQLSVKILPRATYAVFTLVGEQITSDWSMLIFGEWLPAAGYEGQHTHSIQLYDERFKGLDAIGDSVLEVHIPVKSHQPGNK